MEENYFSGHLCASCQLTIKNSFSASYLRAFVALFFIHDVRPSADTAAKKLYQITLIDGYSFLSSFSSSPGSFNREDHGFFLICGKITAPAEISNKPNMQLIPPFMPVSFCCDDCVAAFSSVKAFNATFSVSIASSTSFLCRFFIRNCLLRIDQRCTQSICTCLCIHPQIHCADFRDQSFQRAFIRLRSRVQARFTQGLCGGIDLFLRRRIVNTFCASASLSASPSTVEGT